MCLIAVGWRVHPDYPLIVAANRDEFHARPSAPAAFWPDAPNVLGGRDLEAGGTWLGATTDGRFAAVTNVREPAAENPTDAKKRSRGALTAEFLRSTASAVGFSNRLDGNDYAGFNLLLADQDNLLYVSNRAEKTQILAPGIYGLSNHRLDSPWPKLLKLRAGFAAALNHLPDETAFFELLADRDIVPDAHLPETGVPLHWERLLSAVFVQSPDYGTRASTVLMRDTAGRISLHEKSFDNAARVVHASRISTGV